MYCTDGGGDTGGGTGGGTGGTGSVTGGTGGRIIIANGGIVVDRKRIE